MTQAHDPDQQIAERYFLGELTDTEAEAFEAHYFECPSCAEYVVEEQMLFDAGRAVAREQKPEPVPVPAPTPMPLSWRWRQWIPSAAAAMFVLAVGLPTAMRGPAAQLARSEIVPPTTLQMSVNRAEASQALSFPLGEPVSLDVEVPPLDDSFPVYEICTRNRSTGAVIGCHKRTHEQLNKPIPLLLSDLPAGSYEVVIEGVRREDGKRSTIVTSSTFEVRVKKQGENP